MATTTAAITLTSTDLLSDSLSLSPTATLTKAGGAVGLDQTSGLGRKTTTSNSQYVLFDGTDYSPDKAHKLYLKNTSTTDSEYFVLTVNSEDIGRIYAGDWVFMPWSGHDADNDIKITPSVSTTMTLEYMLIYEA